MSTGNVTPTDIEANIASESYFTAADGVRGAPGGSNHILSEYVTFDGSPLSHITFCVLIPKRGDPITAYSLAADPADLNPAVERYIARQKAFNKLGELMAYAAKAALND